MVLLQNQPAVGAVEVVVGLVSASAGRPAVAAAVGEVDIHQAAAAAGIPHPCSAVAALAAGSVAAVALVDAAVPSVQLHSAAEEDMGVVAEEVADIVEDAVLGAVEVDNAAAQGVAAQDVVVVVDAEDVVL